MKEPKLYPLRRANLEQPCIETLELLPPTNQERYEMVLHELGQAAFALNEIYASMPGAQARLLAAQEARDAFFREAGAYE